MVVGESPDWLPPGFTVKIKYNDGRRVKYYFNVATGKKYYSKNEVIRCATECNSLLDTPQMKDADDRPSLIVKVDSVTISDKLEDSAAWLPSGWEVQERIRMSGSKQGAPYKVYTELSTGRKFYSKAAATLYLNTIAHADTTTKQNNIGNVDEPLPDKSLQVLPMTNTSRIHEKKRKGNSLVKIDNVDEPVPEKLPQIISMVNSDDTHDQIRKENSLVQIDNAGETPPDISPLVKSTTNTDGIVVKKRKGSSFVTVATERTTADGLPAGWIKEIRTSKSGQKIRKDPFYTDPVSGYEFRSRADALRYLKTNDISSCVSRPLRREDGIKLIEKKDPIDNVNEPVPEKLPHIISMVNSDDTHDQIRKENSRVQIDNAGETLPDMSPLVKSTTNSDGIVVKKRKGTSYVTVATERTTADGLPAGWIKEIRTSKSGQKIRKDPFYTDPVSGYEFRSRTDALRYLKTNDIRSCVCRPLRREDGIKLIEKKDPTSNQATQKLSTQKSELFLGEESSGGAESAGNKNPSDTDTKTLENKQVAPVGALSIQEKVSNENFNENAKMGNTAQADNDVSKEENGAVAVGVAMSSTPMPESGVAMSSTPMPESGGRSNLGSRKSKKRMNSSLPLRTSKRLAGSKPEIQSNLNLNERSLKAALRGSTVREVDTSPNFPLEASDIPQKSNIEPPKEATDHTVRNEETLQGINQLQEVEKPPTEGSPIREEQSVAKESHDKQLCYDFGTWSDPLEFALKTLRGEIPIDDTLTFPSFFDDGCFKKSDSDFSLNFQSEFAPNPDSLKKKDAVDPSPASSSPSLSTLGNISFNSRVGFNFQPSSEVGKKDSQSQTKLNP